VRTVNIDPPAEIAVRDGLAYALFLPAGAPAGGVVVLHGAGSCKEAHYDFARHCRARGLAAVAFDQRGHGESEGALDARAATDVATIAAILREHDVPAIGLRGSSMGGYLALVSAAAVGAAAVVAICAAPARGLRRGLAAGRFDFRADPGFDAFLAAHDERDAVTRLDCPLLLLHAEGDEQVPVELSRELHAAAPQSRLVTVPGGHHRSVQHDGELQDLSVRFLLRAFGAASDGGDGVR
jgi:uncharacterized protein